MQINVTRSSMPEFEEYCEEIKELWESRWLTNNGKKHQKLESDLKDYLGVDNITLFTNGHLALENAIASMNFPKGSEVITTPFTFVSTTHAITRNGLVPVFCDINEKDYTIDVTKIEDLITEKTVAIVPVHVYGNICDVERIEEIAKKHSLKVIYDAAHAFAVEYKGRSIASYGDASMFSFHATKVFNTIEGGAVCYKDALLSKTLDTLKNFGLDTPENDIYIAGNAKMNEFQAAMGICNLRHINSEIEKRKAVASCYRSRLSGKEGIILCDVQDGVKSNYAYFPAVFENYKYSRDEIVARLGTKGIFARKYFYPTTNGFECYKDFETAGAEKTPIAKRISENILCLPMYADLSEEDVNRICDIILD